MKIISIGLLCMSCISTLAHASEASLKSIIQNHLTTYGKQEYFTGIQVSIKAADKRAHYAVGVQSHDASSQALTHKNLFDIGSITKSYTTALALIAAQEEKLDLQKPLKAYLSQYPHWGALSLTGLFNMSTGIPNYSDSPTINYDFSNNIKRFWTEDELISLVYPKKLNPPLKPGYFYSNTGYVLLDMILHKQYKKTYSELLNSKIIEPLGLKDTFYPVPKYTPEVLSRMAHGYSYNMYDNPELLGRDVTENNLSWAGAAGAIVATSDDVLDWIDNLFVKQKLLTPAQQKEMQSMISLDNGKPLAQTIKEDPKGFGLGIAEVYDEHLGRFWFYEGKTLGYRALYMYVPCNQVILVALFNSATNAENDHAHDLLKAMYQAVLDENSELKCKT